MFTSISVFSVCSFAFRENNLKTLLSLDFLSKIDIFYTKGESIIPHLLCHGTYLLRGAKRHGNLMSLRKHYEVTTLSAIVRDELHTSTPRICGILNS